MKMVPANPCASRLAELVQLARRRRLDAVLVFGQKNVLSLTNVDCDNACLVVSLPPRGKACVPIVTFTTDFRYVPAVRRTAPYLKVVDCRRDLEGTVLALLKKQGRPARLGFEGDMPACRYLQLTKAFPKAKFVDLKNDLLDLRAVKTPAELARVAAAEALNDQIWALAQKDFKPGMTEKDLQRVIRAYMNALGDGEAFETIVCAGANAAECHHVPDDTVWQKGEPLLVDMGVKLDGVCSDMTRCLTGGSRDAEYARVYAAVLAANRAAIAACRPGMTGKDLDAVARKVLRKAGYVKAFGHALGHGVGYEIHEHPVASPRSEMVLKPGMCVTIEPGVYLPGKLGVRIEDLVVVTETGCDVLSHSAK